MKFVFVIVLFISLQLNSGIEERISTKMESKSERIAQEETISEYVKSENPELSDQEVTAVVSAAMMTSDPALVIAIASAESNLNPKAIAEGGTVVGVAQVNKGWYSTHVGKNSSRYYFDPYVNLRTAGKILDSIQTPEKYRKESLKFKIFEYNGGRDYAIRAMRDKPSAYYKKVISRYEYLRVNGG